MRNSEPIFAQLPMAQNQTNEELVRNALNGSRWAEEVLYRRYANKVLTFGLRLLRHQADAEDVVQDTFVQAFNKLNSLREPAKFHTWLMQIAVSKMHRLFRRRKLHRAFWLRQQHEDSPLCEQLTSHTPPAHRLEFALLDKAFDQMTTNERICWVLRYFEEHTIREISEITGLSGTSVKRRIAEAVRLVKQYLGENAHD